MSNFKNLKKGYPNLYELGKKAEKYSKKDLNACIINLGIMNESIAKIICEKRNIEESDQFSRINILYNNYLITKDVNDTMHQLRIKRNIAMHDAENLSLKSADDLLEKTIDLSNWFYSQYGKKSIKEQKRQLYTERVIDILKKKIATMKTSSIDISLEDLLKKTEYPEKKYKAPCCCQAMKHMMHGNDNIISETKGKQAALQIRYYKSNHTEKPAGKDVK